MIFCAAGDPGGSRALMPVIDELERRGRHCLVLDHGFLGRELRAGLRDRLVPDEEAESALGRAGAFLFGSSAADGRPLRLARRARELGRPVVHVLDNWTNYARRLNHDGEPPLIPDLYGVMDEEARRGALAEGLPEGILRVTGHPALGSLAGVVAQRRAKELITESRRGLGLPEDRKILAFVNEPLRQVLGTDTSAPNHYGFTEDRVLTAWARALAPLAADIYVVLLPHPKDDPDELARLWGRIQGRLEPAILKKAVAPERATERGDWLGSRSSRPPGENRTFRPATTRLRQADQATLRIEGQVLRLAEGRAILPVTDAVAGMASILLYESWLCGLPTLAMQPGVRAEPIRRFSRLPDVVYADDEARIPQATADWFQKAGTWAASPRPELDLHRSAPSVVADQVEQLMERR